MRLLLPTLLLATTFCQAQTWVQQSPLPAGGRQAPSSFVINGRAYVVGGWNFNTFFTELWMYDPLTDGWEQKASLPGPGRQTGVAFAIDGIGYFGTGNAGNTKYNDWYAYDPTSDTWTQKASLPGNGRNGAVGWTLNGQGYVATGDAPNYSNSVFRYDPVLDQWTTLPNFGGTPRRYAAGFVLGGFAYICNGQGSNGHGNTCWRFDPTDNSWTQVTSYPSGCSGGMAVTLNGRAQLFLGYNGGTYQSTVHEYDPLTNAWTPLTNFTGGIRAYATTFMIGNEGYLTMGYGTALNNDLWKVDGIPTEIATVSGNNDLHVWPNPANDQVQVTVNGTPARSMRLMDGIGRTVHTAPSTNGILLVQGIAPGIYVLECEGADGVVRSQRLRIQH